MCWLVCDKPVFYFQKLLLFMKFILGKKLEMTQIWRGDEVLAVTRVQAGPCKVVQIKGAANDGYSAVQIGYGERKLKNIKKPQQGHLKDSGNVKYLREFRIADEQLKKGDLINVSVFQAGDIIDIVGTSKGKGFQGVVKRHGFHGHSHTHGTKDQERSSGSVGPKGPAHVFKGTRMGGRMGGDRTTIKNLEIVQVDPENNILYIKGAIPGARNGLIMVKGAGEMILAPMVEEKSPVEAEAATTEKKEEVKNEETKAVEEEKTEDKIAE
jgi:large subunit ribosomal protein L3